MKFGLAYSSLGSGLHIGYFEVDNLSLSEFFLLAEKVGRARKKEHTWLAKALGARRR
jgi:hypothetical protein